MKRIATRIIALFLVVCFVSGLGITQATAASFDTIQQLLNSVQADFPNGSYFTTDGRKNSPAEFTKVAGARNVKYKENGREYAKAWTCLAYAKYVWAKVFGLEATQSKNRIEVGAGRAGVTATWDYAKPGDLIYFYSDANLSNWKHAAIFLGKSGSTISLVDCNYASRDANKEHNKILYYSVTCGKSGWPYSYVRVYRATNYEQVAGTEVQTTVNSAPATHTLYFDANGGTVSPTSKVVTEGSTVGTLPVPTREGYEFLDWCLKMSSNGGMLYTAETLVGTRDETISAIWKPIKQVCTSHVKGTFLYADENHPHYNYYKCANCGETFKDGSTATVASCTTCNPPKATCTSHVKGTFLYYSDSHPHYNYYKCANCGEIFKDGSTATVASCTTCNPPKAACTSHVKGTFLYYSGSHPHYNYYKCANCGETFKDGSTATVSSCTTCNPPQTKTIVTDWSDWSDTAYYASSTREVETRRVKVSDGYTEYRYGRYVDPTGGHDCWCARYLEGLSYVSGSASLQYSDWSQTRYGTSGRNWTCGYCGGYHTGVDHTGSDGRAWWKEYISPSGGSYYWEETRTTAAQYKTQYRYRDTITVTLA